MSQADHRCGLCSHFMVEDGIDHGRCCWLEQQKQPDWARYIQVPQTVLWRSRWSGQGCEAFEEK